MGKHSKIMSKMSNFLKLNLAFAKLKSYLYTKVSPLQFLCPNGYSLWHFLSLYLESG